MDTTSPNARLEEWEDTLLMLQMEKEAAKERLRDYDRKKPSGAELHSTWHQERRNLSWEISTCRAAIECAEIQIRNLRSVLAWQSEQTSTSHQTGSVEDLIAKAPEELTPGEQFIRACVIRQQKALEEKGGRTDATDRPGQSGGYQIE